MANLTDYRQDIHFFRFLAIIIVFLFHLKISFFSYGYLGVDIFFFISGFLISKILYELFIQNKYNYFNFLKKRILRILPLYFIVALLILFFFYFIFSPFHLEELIKSSQSSSFLVSNFYFLLNSNYFDIDSIFKPLLHTWSLSVETHFYIFFPIFFLIIIKFLKNKTFFILYFIILLNLSLISIYEEKVNLIFYFSPLRAFEFLIGTITFLNANYKKKSYLLNLILFLFVIFNFLNSNLELVIKLALLSFLHNIILFNLLPNILCNSKIVKNIGDYSYSIYLIHWPIIVYINYYLFRELFFYEKILIFIGTILISKFTYSKIELYFISGYNNLYKLFFVFFLGIVLLISSYLISFYNYNLKYYSEEDKVLLESLNFNPTYESLCSNFLNLKDNKLDSFEFNPSCQKSNKNLLIIGDSHSLDLYNAISINSKEFNVLGLSQDGCRLSNSLKMDEINNCNYSNIIKFIENNEYYFDYIIYTQKGSYLFKNKENAFLDKSSLDRLKNKLTELKMIVGNKLYVFGPQREYKNDLHNYLSMKSKNLGNRFNLNENKDIELLDNLLEDELKKIEIKYVSKINTIQINNEIIRENSFLYNNKTHWSNFGEKFYGKKILHLNLLN